jgi:hypothetical protein
MSRNSQIVLVLKWKLYFWNKFNQMEFTNIQLPSLLRQKGKHNWEIVQKNMRKTLHEHIIQNLDSFVLIVW